MIGVEVTEKKFLEGRFLGEKRDDDRGRRDEEIQVLCQRLSRRDIDEDEFRDTIHKSNRDPTER